MVELKILTPEHHGQKVILYYDDFDAISGEVVHDTNYEYYVMHNNKNLSGGKPSLKFRKKEYKYSWYLGLGNKKK